MSRRTPGPWEYDSETEEVFRTLDGGARDEGICLVDTSHEDGKLIAAAPELLEALEVCARALTIVHPDSTVDAEMHEALCVARAAIAKAEGRS
jgi:hypothetical protein